MNDVQIFTNEEFGKIRTLMIEECPWFVGKDIATILGYKDTVNAIKTHVDEEDKGGWQITTPFGKQRVIIINESGLYSLILSSKLPTAKKFKRWVTSEVLPAIRKYGKYELLPSEPETEYLDYTTLELDQRIRIANILATCRRERLQLVAKVLSLDCDDIRATITSTPNSEAVTLQYLEEAYQAMGERIPVSKFYENYRKWCISVSVLPIGKTSLGKLFKKYYPIESVSTSYTDAKGVTHPNSRQYRKMEGGAAK